MKFVLLLCALVAAVFGIYVDNTAEFRLPYPGYNRVYDEFDHPCTHRHCRYGNGWYSYENTFWPVYGTPYVSNDAPAQTAYGSAVQNYN
uniref:Uncharacterized protein n=1 Tax=Caenorhabditis japonica TaxID=281687 RepID=A0A8R1HV34_CAEJA